MVCKVVPGNVYALFGRYCRPHSSSITSSILNWHGRLFAALAGHHGPIGMRLSFPHPILVLIGHVESTTCRIRYPCPCVSAWVVLRRL